ncbi:MAG: hypothetical protein A3E84_04875 [Gammaproteobacteria bacterium RIFCSPHIGHO2_12_FULL_42_13]|nr:MAG: hypothetical protein A3E84_04875 [Gammaproteobacteria bacterium RIFCSPHIGHO2_12_FULL_42_13]
MTKDYLTHHQFMLLQMFLMILAMIVLVLVGIIADKKSPGKVMQVGCWFLIMLSYPLLLLVDSGNWSGIVVGLILLVIGNEIFLGPVNAYLKNLFVMQFRYRGSSLSFCLGVALLGGLTPIVEHYLYQTTGRFSSISIWLIFIALGTTVSLSYVHRKRTDYVGDVVAITAGAREL